MIKNGFTFVHQHSKPGLRKWLLPALLIPVIAVSLLVGCQLQNLTGSGTSSATKTAVQTPANEQTATAAVTPAVTASASSESNTLVLWLPPQFDPSGSTPLGIHIKNRLDAFQKEHSNLTIEVRLKALDGRGGLLDSLANASTAAPGALPALVALQYRDLESASLKGLLLPLDNKTHVISGEDWLPYSAQMGMIQGKSYGIPFAGDALVLVYHPLQTPYPPSTWQELSSQSLPVIFPAADPDATVVTAIYLTAGGSLLDPSQQPILESAALQKTFVILNNGTQSGAFPIWSAQYSTFADSWKAYQSQTSGYAVVWASQYLANPPTGSDLTALPKINSTQVTLAQGWVWCIPEMTSQSQTNAVMLAEYLSETGFVNELDQLAGYLPVHKSGLDTIKNPRLSQTISAISASAQILPAGSTINSISPILQDSTVEIIKMQLYYQDALNQALSHFKK